MKIQIAIISLLVGLFSLPDAAMAEDDPNSLGRLEFEKLDDVEKANAEVAQVAQTVSKPAAINRASQRVLDNRKALVIGNDLYTDVPPLTTAGGDAEAMDKALVEVGYKVTKYLNLNKRAFRVALRDFRQQVDDGDEVLFFYSGHGVQLENLNYLLPIDIKGDSRTEVAGDAILLQRFLNDMEDKKAKFTLAVVDTCRTDPFGYDKGKATRGIAYPITATGQMVMFSAGSGGCPVDELRPQDTEKNSLFTRIFIREMLKPGISVDRVLRNVRSEVFEKAKSIGFEQKPALYDESIGDFYFVN